jgi:hypothetical protein
MIECAGTACAGSIGIFQMFLQLGMILTSAQSSYQGLDQQGSSSEFEKNDCLSCGQGSGTVRTEQSEDLAALNRKGDVIETRPISFALNLITSFHACLS